MKKENIIDTYCKIDEDIKRLEVEKKEMRSMLDEIITTPGAYSGNEYEITALEKMNYTYDVPKLFTALGKSIFLKCCTVSAQKLKEFIAPIEMQKYIEDIKTTMAIRAKKKGE